MLSNKSYYILLVATYVLSVVFGDDTKGSLTFVIDDTVSMRNDIRTVQARSFDIFDAVVNSNDSVIDEFVIVTFNDPETQVRIVTNDKYEFKRTLRSIRAGGGGDCPEMSMTGIQKALETSKPHSFLYVFTDASSKDSDLYENVKSLSIEKSSKVTFLLTGECKYSNHKKTAYLYDELAAATSGQVFQIKKHDITKIINYIIATVGGKRTVITRKDVNGCGNKVDVTLDSKLWDVFIAVSGRNPEFNVLIPDGDDAEVVEFVKTEKSKIVKLKAKPGVYSVEVSSCDKTTLVVTASTSIGFRHGFSSTMPHHINETSTRPILDVETYLAIELDSEDRDLNLKSAELWDTDENYIQYLSLTLTDEKQQLYISELFSPPDIPFKIVVMGHVNKTEEVITRISSTTIEYQSVTD